MGYSSTNSINIYDASEMYNFPPVLVLNQVQFCYQDSMLSKSSTIVASLYHGLSVAKSYFLSKGRDYPAPIKVLAHFPENEEGPYAPSNEAAWNQAEEHFEFGDGDFIKMRPPVSVDVIAHEYGHRILYNRYSILANAPTDTFQQAGAIHEGVADIFSVLVRKHVTER